MIFAIRQRRALSATLLEAATAIGAQIGLENVILVVEDPSLDLPESGFEVVSTSPELFRAMGLYAAATAEGSIDYALYAVRSRFPDAESVLLLDQDGPVTVTELTALARSLASEQADFIAAGWSQATPGESGQETPETQYAQARPACGLDAVFVRGSLIDHLFARRRMRSRITAHGSPGLRQDWLGGAAFVANEVKLTFRPAKDLRDALGVVTI